MAGLFEEAFYHSRPQIRVSPCSRYAKNLQVRIGQRESQCKRIVDIIANIGIDDDLLCRPCRRRGRLSACACAESTDRRDNHQASDKSFSSAVCLACCSLHAFSRGRRSAINLRDRSPSYVSLKRLGFSPASAHRTSVNFECQPGDLIWIFHRNRPYSSSFKPLVTENGNNHCQDVGGSNGHNNPWAQSFWQFLRKGGTLCLERNVSILTNRTSIVRLALRLSVGGMMFHWGPQRVLAR